MIKYLFIILLLSTIYLAKVPTNAPFDKRVLDGRVAVEKYRTVHNTMYDEKGLRIDKHDELLGILLKELEATGYEKKPDMIDEFFYESRDYNAKQLGYEDKEDFKNNATEEDIINYLNSWK